jgi:OOP family OmpA-OmpF porin
MAVNTRGKIQFTIIAVVLTVIGIRFAMTRGWIPTPNLLKSVATHKVDLPSQSDAQVSNVKAVAYPSTEKATVAANRFPFDIWEWNAYLAMLYANGGAETTHGSLMEKYGVNLGFKRTDSNAVMKQDLLACAKQIHDGEKTCTTGAAAIVVMGDGSGQWLADLNQQLAKLGPEYQLQIIGAVGRSNGEDALLGPAEWKSDPKTMKGKTIVGVIRDGDWNIALNYLGSNTDESGKPLKNNPDLTTYDPDAINWISAPDEDYIKAVTEVYIPNRCEDRKELKDGHPTGKTVKVCPDGVVTWYPGDKQAIDGRPGTTKIVSSREYSAQMPSVIIGIKKFFSDNHEQVVGLLSATFQAADQVKAFDEVRKRAGEISAKVYNDQNGDFWYKAFGGYKVNGQPVGGSAVFNLQDNLNYFGIAPGHTNNMRATYETFGRIAAENYPDLFKDNPIPEYKTVVDTQYILGAQAKLSSDETPVAEAEKVDYSSATSNGTVLGHAALYISFDTGSDALKTDGIAQLTRLKESLAVNKSLAIQIDGYTDNSGSAATNNDLSQRRAQAVKSFLQQGSSEDFPDSRFKSVHGHGSESPIVPNTTADNKARNRRVELTQIGG